MQLKAAEQAWLDSGERRSPFVPGGAGSPEQQLAAAAAAFRATGQSPPAGGAPAPLPPLSAAEALRLAVGGEVLRYIESDLAGRSDEGSKASLAAIRGAGPELDAIRDGCQALLRYFVASGGWVGSVAWHVSRPAGWARGR